MKNLLKMGMVSILSVSFLAGCGLFEDESEKPQEFMTNTVTPDDLAPNVPEGSGNTESIEGWAHVGTEIIDDDSYGNRFLFGGFTSNDTFTIIKERNADSSGKDSYSFSYKVSEGMEIPVGNKNISITLLKSEIEHNRIQVRLETTK